MKSFLRQIKNIDSYTVKTWQSLRQHVNAVSRTGDNFDRDRSIETASIGWRRKIWPMLGGLGCLMIPAIVSLPAHAQTATTPALTCGTIYGSYQNSSGPLYQSLRIYTPPTSIGPEITSLGSGTGTSATSSTVAAIAIDPFIINGQRRIYFIENYPASVGGNPRFSKLFYYDGSTIVNTNIQLRPDPATYSVTKADSTSVSGVSNTFNRMAFANDGTLYIGDSNKKFYRFTPDRTGLTGGGSISAAIEITDNLNNSAQLQSSGGGDFAFDSKGRMYIVAYDSNSSNVTQFRLFQVSNPLSANPTAILLGVKTAALQTIAGLAFKDTDNKLYIQGSAGQSYNWDLSTNDVPLAATSSIGSIDLASCN
jgi:hypothetical protein